MKACIQGGVLPDCPLFHNKLHLPLSGVHNLNVALSILKISQTPWVLAPTGGLEPHSTPPS